MTHPAVDGISVKEDTMAHGWGDGPFDIGGRGPQVRIPNLPKIPTRTILSVVVGVLLLIIALSTFYQIQPDEVGVVQYFGAYVRTTEPGLHFKLPLGIERVTKVPVLRQLKQEFGFRTLRAGKTTEYAPASRETAAEAMMLTGDLNVAVVEWIVQYRISDPKAFLFHVRDPVETFRYMSEASMRQVVGDHSVDEVITIGREDIARAAKDELQQMCDLYGIGIEVQQLVLRNVNPPEPVRPAFNEVNQAIQEKERAINEAWADYNKSVPLAKGQAEQTVRAAEGYALQRVNAAEGDAKRFESVLAEYRRAPLVTRRRLYLEGMADILPRIDRTLVLDEKARGVLPLLQLGTTTGTSAAGAGKEAH
jgi:membrane protease subunit HflK